MSFRFFRAAACLLLATLLLLSACGKKDKDYKPIGTAAFDEKIRAHGAVTEVYTGSAAPAAAAQAAVGRVEFRSESGGWEGTYCEFLTLSEAREFFDAVSSSADAGTLDDPGGTYAAFSFTGTNDTVFRIEIVGNTFLGIGYPKDDKAAKAAVEEILKDLGY